MLQPARSALLAGSGRGRTRGEKLPPVLFRLRANEPASPPHNRRKKQFILTNGESLQRGWPFLSKLVYHTEAYVLEQRGEGTSSQVIYASLTEGDDQQLGRTRLQKIPAYPAGVLVAGNHGVCKPAINARPPQQGLNATLAHSPLSIPLSNGFISPLFSLQRG